MAYRAGLQTAGIDRTIVYMLIHIYIHIHSPKALKLRVRVCVVFLFGSFSPRATLDASSPYGHGQLFVGQLMRTLDSSIVATYAWTTTIASSSPNVDVQTCAACIAGSSMALCVRFVCGCVRYRGLDARRSTVSELASQHVSYSYGYLASELAS